jgi:3-hydroxyisobutyrate dehydrogenase-like beta-hydroxyacid dehydrogenase
MSTQLKIAVLGLGEEAGLIAAGLQAAGAEVIGFDSAKPKRPPVAVAESAEAAVADADVVLSLNSASASLRVAEGVASALKPGAVFADLNTGTPSLKRKLAEILGDSFVDVAIMKPVAGLAEKVPCAIAGPAAKRFVQLMTPLGMQLDYVSDTAGEAAARNLLRGLLEKGIAAVVVDTLWAAKSLGLQDWAIEAIKAELESSGSETVQAQLDDTGKYPKRKSVEMADVVEMLSEAKYDSTMVNGIELTLSHVIHGRKIPFADLSDD